MKVPPGYEKDELMKSILKAFERRPKWHFSKLKTELKTKPSPLSERLKALKDSGVIQKLGNNRRNPWELVVRDGTPKENKFPTELDVFVIDQCKAFISDYYQISYWWRDRDEDAFTHGEGMGRLDDPKVLKFLTEGGYDVSRLKDERIINKVEGLREDRAHLRIRAAELYNLLSNLEVRRDIYITRPWNDENYDASLGRFSEDMHFLALGDRLASTLEFADRTNESPSLSDYVMVFENAIEEISLSMTKLQSAGKVKNINSPGRPRKND